MGYLSMANAPCEREGVYYYNLNATSTISSRTLLTYLHIYYSFYSSIATLTLYKATLTIIY